MKERKKERTKNQERHKSERNEKITKQTQKHTQKQGKKKNQEAWKERKQQRKQKTKDTKKENNNQTMTQRLGELPRVRKREVVGSSLIVGTSLCVVVLLSFRASAHLCAASFCIFCLSSVFFFFFFLVIRVRRCLHRHKWLRAMHVNRVVFVEWLLLYAWV
jgi:Flp pilus assembly protein TadB